jgi:hypothetical protein
MKKSVKLLITALMIGSTTLVGSAFSSRTIYASTLDNDYKATYDQTMKVVGLAKQYGVKPYWKEGSSPTQNVVSAVSNGKLQTEIMLARTYLDRLPPSIQLMKNTLSEILDDYQHPVYEKIVDIITIVDGDLKTKFEYKTIFADKDFLTMQDNMKVTLSNIGNSRALIKDVPSSFKSSYSSYIDTQTQSILNLTNDFISYADSTKVGKWTAFNFCSFIQKQTYIDTNIYNYVEALKEKARNIDETVFTGSDIRSKLTSIGFESTTLNQSLFEQNFKIPSNEISGLSQFDLYINKDKDILVYVDKTSKYLGIFISDTNLNRAKVENVLRVFYPNLYSNQANIVMDKGTTSSVSSFSIGNTRFAYDHFDYGTGRIYIGVN